MSDIGNRIRALRKKRGLTQVQLARQTGISQSNISQYERFVEPPASALGKIADALNTTVDHLVGRTDNPGPPRLLSEEQLRLLDAYDRGDMETVGRMLSERLRQYFADKGIVPGEDRAPHA